LLRFIANWLAKICVFYEHFDTFERLVGDYIANIEINEIFTLCRTQRLISGGIWDTSPQILPYMGGVLLSSLLANHSEVLTERFEAMLVSPDRNFIHILL